jgi:hypothetical protein
VLRRPAASGTTDKTCAPTPPSHPRAGSGSRFRTMGRRWPAAVNCTRFASRSSVHDLRERERQQLVVVVADDAAEGGCTPEATAVGDRHPQRRGGRRSGNALDDAQGSGGAPCSVRSSM